MRIIGFAGRKRSGKTTLSKYLAEEYDAKIVTVADALKYLLCDILNVSYEDLLTMKDDGKPHLFIVDERCIDIISEQIEVSKDKVTNVLPIGTQIKDVRAMLQVIGTDLIRKLRPTWHVDKMTEAILSYGEDTIVTIDDVRFPNEVEKIKELGGETLFVVRPYYNDWSTHESENSLFWRDFNYNNILINDFKFVEPFIEKYSHMLDDIINDKPYDNPFSRIFIDGYNDNLHDYFLDISKVMPNPLVIEDIKTLKLR